MKIKNAIIALSLLLASFTVGHAQDSTPGETELLRAEIARQEMVLQILKAKLASLETSPSTPTIVIDAQGEMTFEDRPLSKTQLAKKLSEFPQGTKVILAVDSSTGFREVQSVVQLCSEAGITDVVFSTHQSAPPKPIQ
ncbi:ExbD/TolR family protein [Cerasicoccus arenae]|uniref:Biopolymer transporter ExbD n=1 Tax=Cerasicoccus arenae TaxID=424488 RepID=A0A8J3DGD1_9BACT|nr:biopolymer transporter ExbD [Cerasicoccus arenae]MBK1856899.1 biopolymer transporter ExbD [Cerasicoccus arenae]GHB89736.1 hypothetical protein GCM10007047_00240 [Cerasicoccus arenae]